MSDKYTTTEQHASYGVGRQMGEQLHSNPFDGLDKEAVIAGVTDALDGKPPEVNPDLINAAFKVMQGKMKDGESEKATEGEAFLAENAKKDGITITESGMQYEIITAGSGDKPTATSTVRTHYHGTLIDGTVFDSSYDRGEPAEFPVNGVIAGWTEALQMMEVGSKWRLYLPHGLAYGERGAGGSIKPFAALIFDVELIAIL
ncbi:MAG: FKBP-type peptidyl-prolyl cis-trans isomerase [Immundisolibacteraceae bacterium]|nr:FKBP-type peptidyl-prolyl cis-trans isomerase [Immundisolibacteraceae bacterium]